LLAGRQFCKILVNEVSKIPCGISKKLAELTVWEAEVGVIEEVEELHFELEIGALTLSQVRVLEN
jgi:hypothetical protein